MKNNNNIIDKVIKNDYCIGCGACSFVNPDFKIGLDQFGMLKASYQGRVDKTFELEDKVCPFSNFSKNEDDISNLIFNDLENKNEFLGKYINTYVGHVSEKKYREKGSSGGFGKWILHELLEKDKVDYVIQVVTESKENELFTYKIFERGDDILTGSKSAYYPVTLKGALEFIKCNEGRYAITAIPCFSKALRNLCLNDEVLKTRIKFIIGIICGHLKSTAFAELLAWQLNVEPKALRGIEFRGKIKGLRANDKGVYAFDQQGLKSITQSSKKLFGGDWGYGFFKYKACDYCDDVVGETTDVSVGDAWLEDYMDDHEGNNVLVVRNSEIQNLIYNALNDGRLNLNLINEDEVVKSQKGGISHRREGLKFRLFLKVKKNEWYPNKRVEPSSTIPERRKKIYIDRETLRDSSHSFFKRSKDMNDLNFFINNMAPLIEEYHRRGIPNTVSGRAKSYIKWILKYLNRAF